MDSRYLRVLSSSSEMMYISGWLHDFSLQLAGTLTLYLAFNLDRATGAANSAEWFSDTRAIPVFPYSKVMRASHYHCTKEPLLGCLLSPYGSHATRLLHRELLFARSHDQPLHRTITFSSFRTFRRNSILAQVCFIGALDLPVVRLFIKSRTFNSNLTLQIQKKLLWG